MTIVAERPQATAAPQAHEPAGDLDMDAIYTVAGMPGVAWRLTGYATEWTEERWVLACDDEDCMHDDEACYLYDEPEQTERRDMVRAVMVGDDRVHIVDVDDLTEISDDDYCPGCGQTGCRAYAS